MSQLSKDIKTDFLSKDKYFESSLNLKLSQFLGHPVRLYNLFIQRMQSSGFFDSILGPVSDNVLINRVSKERAFPWCNLRDRRPAKVVQRYPQLFSFYVAIFV